MVPIRLSIAFLTCSFLLATLAAQDLPLFRAATTAVVVPAIVTDRAGRFVRGLTAEQFVISDGGVNRAITQFGIESVPVSLAVLLDISGSMTQDPKARAADDARWADTRRAVELLLTRLGTADEVLFAAFNDKVLAAPWTQDFGQILRLFDSLRPGGGTALLDAVRQIAPALRRARHQRRVLLLISDGNDTQTPAVGLVPPPPTERYSPEQMVLSKVGESGRMRRELVINGSRDSVRQTDALLYAIGIGTRKGVPVDTALLESLTRDSGGYAEILRDPSQISAAVARLCDDLQSQYLLTFEPAHADGRFHTIRVRTRDNRYRVRARSGYLAASPQP